MMPDSKRPRSPDAPKPDPVDRTSEDTFPASDAPGFTPTTGAGAGETGRGGPESHRAGTKGVPHDDRHATETASGRLEGHDPPEHKDR